MPMPPFAAPSSTNDDDLFKAGGINMFKNGFKRNSKTNEHAPKRTRVERVTIERCADSDSNKNEEDTSFSSVKWNDLHNETHTPFVAESCWACANSDHGKNRDLYPTVAGLFDLFYNEYHCRDLDELCNLVHEYHESEIRQKNLERGIPCAAFPTDKIREHFLRHALNPSIEIGQQLRQLQTLETLMRDNVSKKNDETGEIVPDYKAIDLLLKIQKQTQSTLLLNPKVMSFYDANTSVIK